MLFLIVFIFFNFDFLLIFTTDKTFKLENLNDFLEEHVVKRELLNAKYFDENTKEFTLSFEIKNNAQPTIITEHLHAMPSIKTVEILTGKNTSEF